MYIVLGIIVALILYLIFKYNGFVTLRNRSKEAWADIDVQLKRRYNLIPNLVNARSEERRVGKECRSRWSPYH